MSLGLLQQVHAQLLAAKPTTAPSMNHGDGTFREVGEMLPDQRRVEDDIRAGGLILESLGWRRNIIRITGLAGMVARRASAQFRCFFSRPFEGRDAGRISRGVEVATP